MQLLIYSKMLTPLHQINASGNREISEGKCSCEMFPNRIKCFFTIRYSCSQWNWLAQCMLMVCSCFRHNLLGRTDVAFGQIRVVTIIRLFWNTQHFYLLNKTVKNLKSNKDVDWTIFTVNKKKTSFLGRDNFIQNVRTVSLAKAHGQFE